MISNSSCIGIYSTGLLGASIGLSLKASRFPGTILGFSSSEGISVALNSGAVDQGFGYEQLEEQIENIDILFLCSPIKTIIHAISKLSDCRLKEGVSSLMSAVQKERSSRHLLNYPACPFYWRSSNGRIGKKRSISSHLRPFSQCTLRLTPRDNVSAGDIDEFAEFLRNNLGCRTLIIDAESHDSIVAATSHIPHLLSVMLVNHVRSLENRFPDTLSLTAGGFRDMTRIAASPYPMWKDIFETNRDNIELQID
jgi:prephenate dehydrogenase